MSEIPTNPATPTPEPGSDDLGFPLPQPPRGSRIGVIVAVTVLVGGGFAFRYLGKGSSNEALSSDIATETKAPQVEVMKATVLSSDHALSLPGTVKPLEETKLFPRVQGYVRAWHVDIGDKVTAGQVLAEIDTPELAAELSQARAQLLSARANVKQASAQRDYSKSNSTRYTSLADQQLVSKSQVEETTAKAATDEATVSAAESNVVAMEANVRRLVELQGFAKVIAPFAGTITMRNVDRGALVQTGGTTPMFNLVAIDPIRIFVDVPQSIAPSVKNDTPAVISAREYGGRVFTGKVTRSAGALDEDMHTMTTEIQVPNTDGALMPGMYVQAAITLPTPHRVLEIPATALYSDADGLRVATVDAQRRVKFAKIVIERDTGATIQITAGLTGDEQIIKIAVPSLREGDAVTVAAPSASPVGSGSAK